MRAGREATEEGVAPGRHPPHHVRRGPAIHTGPSVARAHQPTAGTQADVDPEPADWRGRLSAASPLFISGAVCLAIFGVLFADRATGFGSPFAPWILFLALGVTGVTGGIISVAMDGHELPEAEAGRTASSQAPAYRRAHSLLPVHRSPDSHRGSWSGSMISDDEALPLPGGSVLAAADEPEGQARSLPPRTGSRPRDSRTARDAGDARESSEVPVDDPVAGAPSENPFSSDEAIGELDRIMAELDPKAAGKMERRRRSPS